jgi:O-antigen/teichoic acid export membrane protein
VSSTPQPGLGGKQVTARDEDRLGPAGYSRKFVGNAAWMLTGQAVGKVASFVLVVIIARGLGPTEYGIFNFAQSFVPLFLTFGTWGLELAVVREATRALERVSELFSSGFLVRISLASLALAASVGLTPLLTDGNQAFYAVAVLGLALFLDELSGFVGTVFKAFERMSFYALVITTNRILSTVLALVALLLHKGLVIISLTYLIGSLGALAFAWVALKRYFPPIHLRDFRAPVARKLAKQGLPLGVAAVLNTALFRIDAVMLQAIRGAAAVGLYGVAYRFLESFLFVSWSLSSVAFPRMARAGATGVSTRTFETTMVLMLSFYLPVAIASWFIADWVVASLFGERYLPAAGAVPWLTAAGVFYGVAYLSRLAYIALGRRSAITWIAAGALVINMGLNAVLIPKFGFVGAAAVTCSTEVLEAALLLGAFTRVSGYRFSRALLAPVVATTIMGGVLSLSQLKNANAALVAIPVYLVTLAVAVRILAPDAAHKIAGTLRQRRRVPQRGTG